MDELDSGSEQMVAGAAIVEQARASERQHRSHPLTAAGDKMARELRNQRDVRLHPIENDGVDAAHVWRDQRHHRVQRGCAGGAEGDDLGAHDLRSAYAPPDWQ